MDKIQFTDEQIDHIAERAAEVAFKRIYEEVGRSVVKKIFWIVGAGALGYGGYKFLTRNKNKKRR